ncbi:MAG: tetratricopeptide repeat protein [Pseudomonadota bacterium]|nr:tetratricopeptide repeat protein [Pseudomonadota bacterium]
MALPPDNAESFVREVDENLRRDRAQEVAKRYGALIIGGVILLLAAIGGYLYWQSRQAKQAEAGTEQISAVIDDVAGGRAASAGPRLDTLRQHEAEGVSAAASFSRAALALQQGNRKLASTIYGEVAANADLAKPYRDLAIVRGTALDFDAMGPDAVIARLQPLAEPGMPFFGSAGEMVGMALIAKGQRGPAGQLFAKIAADRTVPATLRSRAVQVAGTLGVDASASLPTGNAPAEQ